MNNRFHGRSRRIALHTVCKTLASSFAALVFILGTNAIAVSETKKTCQCEFDSTEYEAYGTNGACGIHMYKKSHSCEVAFSGTGMDTSVLRQTLGESAVQNQFDIAPQIFKQYIAYSRSGEKGEFLKPKFIEDSLIVLERAALFRKSSEKAGVPLKEIDSMFVEFAKANSAKIAETFKGAPPFPVKVSPDWAFYVGQGYVELTFRDSAVIVRVVYFSDPR